MAIAFQHCLEHVRNVQVNQDGLKLNGPYQLFVYDDDLSVLGGSARNIKRNTNAANKETRLALNADETTSRLENSMQHEVTV